MKNMCQSLYLKLYRKIQSDYRHLICLIAVVISAAFYFLFPNSIPRLAETVRDLFTSVLYYVCEIFAPNRNPIKPTVLSMPKWQLMNDIWEPLTLFPFTWEEFKVGCSKYWTEFFSLQNFAYYWQAVGDFMYYLSRSLIIIIPLILLLILSLNNYKKK